MNQLFIIGNGFDLNLGLKTGYQDFYDYYRSVHSGDKDILALKDSIEKGRYSTWSDLEAGLGDYSRTITDPDVFLKCFENIKDVLSEFLTRSYEARSFVSNYHKLTKDFGNPEEYLNQEIQNRYYAFHRSRSFSVSGHEEVSIVTFNYTNTLENLLTTAAGLSFQILHIHGNLESDLVMGVNDEEQIANQAFRSNRDVQEDFIKPEYNRACLNGKNASFESLINQADVVVLFGTSLGETDRKWWRIIGKHVIRENRELAVLYFVHDNKKDIVRHPNRRLRWTEEYQEKILRALEIPTEKKEKALQHIFIGINKELFSLPHK